MKKIKDHDKELMQQMIDFKNSLTPRELELLRLELSKSTISDEELLRHPMISRRIH